MLSVLTITGKAQLFINSYAKALEVIPRQLCDNAGFDATDVLNKLRQKHALTDGSGRVSIAAGWWVQLVGGVCGSALALNKAAIYTTMAGLVCPAAEVMAAGSELGLLHFRC